MFHPWARAAHDGRPAPDVGRFFVRRAQKIAPSYLLALAVFAALYPNRLGSPFGALLQLASHLTFMQTLNPITFGAISGPLWTIGIEVQFYLLFPLLAPQFARRPWLVYAGLVTAAQTYRVAIAGAGQATDFWVINQLPAFLDLFGAGMLAAHAIVNWQHRARTRRRQATAVSLGAFALALGGLAVTAAVMRAGGSDGGHDWLNAHRIAIGPLCATLAVSSTFAVDRWRAIVAMRPLVFLSTISYNLYLWHLEIAVWLQRAGLGPAATFALSVLTATAVAALVTYALERPILAAEIRLGRSGASRSLRPAQRDGRRLEGHHGLVPLVERAKVQYQNPAIGFGTRYASVADFHDAAQGVAGTYGERPTQLVHPR